MNAVDSMVRPIGHNSEVDILQVMDTSEAAHLPEVDAIDRPLLMVTLDRNGHVLSVCSTCTAPQVSAELATWIGKPLIQALTNADAVAYQACFQKVLRTGKSESFHCQFVCDGKKLETVWLLSTIPASLPTRQRLVGLAYPLAAQFVDVSLATISCPPDTSKTSLDFQDYAARLSQITRNIRRTLDLETIWWQTVNGLGQLFQVERCLVCAYQSGDEFITVAAEYRQSSQFPAWQTHRIDLAQTEYLTRAIAAPYAIGVTLDATVEGHDTALAIATRYQDQVNGLIILYVASTQTWSPLEMDLFNELADQVGTAIAHAQLFGESHALARQLQQANTRLVEKHRELEEARRQAEAARKQAEEASRLKSEFLANTSHELRTPLNGMIGFLKLILDGMADDPEEQQEFIREAHTSAIHLLTLINDVLDIAKIEAGKMQIEMGAVNLRELFESVENFTRPQAEQKGLSLRMSLPNTRDAIVLNGNYQRLLQVMLNLVGNAIKFTHDGGVTITAEVKPQKVKFKDSVWPGLVKISVADTGIGVSLEKQDRLFQTFSQVDGERTRQYGGTGLGLAISQKLVEAMGGIVQFISMGEGLGSTVTFTALLYQEPVIAGTDAL